MTPHTFGRSEVSDYVPLDKEHWSMTNEERGLVKSYFLPCFFKACPQLELYLTQSQENESRFHYLCLHGDLILGPLALQPRCPTIYSSGLFIMFLVDNIDH